MRSQGKLILFFCLTAFSCASNELKEDTVTADTPGKSSALKAPNREALLHTDNDTLTIDHKAAVFYHPDSLQMDKRMKEVGEEDFRAGADDYIFYINTAAEYLEKEGLPVLDAKDKTYLKFIMTGNRVQVVKLDTLDELWGIYLFHTGKKAYPADMTIIEDEYRNYFK